MSRKPRNLQPDFSYHITVRCNNREFNLARRECREVILFALDRRGRKYRFRLYALCVMSNHVHYLMAPEHPEDLPKIMHFLNWYTAMSFNRMLNRTGHFWEQRYHSEGFPTDDKERALNTLRYIHANPKAAGMQAGFFYDFSNYGSYERLTDDGLTEWHPAFLELGQSLDECAENYRQFCRRYTPKKKSANKSCWGSRFLPRILKGSRRKQGGSQQRLPFALGVETEPSVVAEVTQQFVNANRAW
jgi:putative transposase